MLRRRLRSDRDHGGSNLRDSTDQQGTRNLARNS
jgi:hypothetical protein